MTRVGSYGRWHQDIYYLSNFNKVYTTQDEIENVKLNHICSISEYIVKSYNDHVVRNTQVVTNIS
jgi:hypothetical protein